MLDTGRHHFDSGRRQQRLHLVGRQRRGDVDIGDGLPKKRIAHRTADKARLRATPRQRLHQLQRLRRCHPVMMLGIQTRHGAESLSAKLTSIEAVAPHI